jgi:chorismate dehydratase
MLPVERPRRLAARQQPPHELKTPAIVTGHPELPSPLRIGAVRYLNAWPLTFCLSQFAPAAEVTVDFPSRLADGLIQGRLDVALVPSIEHLRHPGSTVLSDVCIASDGPVRSVKLYSRVPLARIGSLALDEGSRTSAALVRIWLWERFSLAPELRPLAIGASPADCAADAVMLIGDRGMRPPCGNFAYDWDLGEEWTRWTGLPFVFALWVARPGVELGGTGEALAAARDEGITRLAEIARQAAPIVQIPEAECLAYLRDHLEFRLGARQRQGLERFFDLAARNGLA